jgi:hypothetical protein
VLLLNTNCQDNEILEHSSSIDTHVSEATKAVCDLKYKSICFTVILTKAITLAEKCPKKE